MKEASKRASRRANEKAKDKTDTKIAPASVFETKILGWHFFELPPIIFSFYVASNVGGAVKIPIFLYWSMYRKLWTPTIAMFAGEIFVYLLDHSHGERLFGIEPFNAMVTMFALVSFAERWISPSLRRSLDAAR
jgi:hypothetical protein